MHGFKDTVVPYTQSVNYHKELKKCGVHTKIKIFESNFEFIFLKRFF